MRIPKSWPIYVTNRVHVIFYLGIGLPTIWKFPRDGDNPIFKALYLGFVEIRLFRNQAVGVASRYITERNAGRIK